MTWVDYEQLREQLTPIVHAAVWGGDFPSDEADCCVQEMLKALHKHLFDTYLE